MKQIFSGMILVLLLLIVGVFGFIAYQFIAGDNRIEFSSNQQRADKEPSSEESHDKESSDDSEEPEGDPPSIDVQTTQFSQGFMNADVRSGFYGVGIGLSRDAIEKKFGKSDGRIEAGQSHAEKYGNVAVKYNSKDKAEHIYVAPTNVTVEAFKSVHGTPTIENSDGLVYDDNPNNSFSILITTKNGKITAIENADQIQR